MTTPEQEAEIRARLEAATPGPITVDPYKPTDLYTWIKSSNGVPIFGTAGRAKIADAEFYAHARTDVPDLLATTAHQRAEIADLKAKLAEAQKDSARLDWLEAEMRYEQIHDGYRSLFRRNYPITRTAIDAAMSAPAEPQKEDANG